MRVSLVSAILLIASLVSASTPPPRYLPAPKGRGYLMVFGSAFPVGSLSIHETKAPVPGAGNDHVTDIEWKAGRYEFGATVGYGLGPWWFIKGTDLSVSLPFGMRIAELDEYTLDRIPDVNPEGLGTLYSSLHPNTQAQISGGGLGDIQAAVVSLFGANPGAGRFIAAGVKVGLPTGASSAKQFTKIIHGDETAKPGDGNGVLRIIPAISGVQSIMRQRIYFNFEYGIPMGKDKFDIDTADMLINSKGSWDSNTTFTEEFTPGGVIAGTLGMETTMNFWGVSPGLEVNFKQYMKSKWTENGRDGLVPTGDAAPAYTPEFLTTAGWAMGVPLKDMTEVEIALTLGLKPRPSDQVKIFLSYIWNTYGNLIGARMTFTNLFEGISEEAILRGSGPGAKAMEVNVAPLLDAPPPPSGRVLMAVTTPVFGAGVTEEMAAEAVRELRKQLDRAGSYNVISDRDMAQLATEPCGEGACGAKIGRALRLQGVVVGKLAKTSAGLTLSVWMVSINENTISAPESATAADMDALKKAMPDLLRRLTKPEVKAKTGGAR